MTDNLEEGSPLRVALKPAEFLGWTGAADLLRMLLVGFTAIPGRFDDVCLLNATPLPSRRLKEALGLAPKKQARKLDPSLLADMGSAQSLLKFVNYPKNRLVNTLGQRRIDFYLTPSTLGNAFPKPWICYIHDLQHKHYPDFFSEEDRAQREKHIQKALEEAPTLLTNSKSVVNDVANFYPTQASKIISMPFSPLLRPAWLEYDVSQALSKYEIASPYFIICNQFWVHKNHSTAFMAFKHLLDRIQERDVFLLCTGALEEYRSASHIGSLRVMLEELGVAAKVRLLGHIPKQDQISLLKGAVAAIQPTLFEGSPVGLSGHEAIALGVPLIASDIEVNREVEGEGNVSFFTPTDAERLAILMEAALQQRAVPSIPSLIGQSKQRQEKLCNFLWQAGTQCVSAHSSSS